MKDILTTLQKAPMLKAMSASAEQYLLFLARLSHSDIHQTPHASWMINTMADIWFNSVIYASFPKKSAENEISEIIKDYEKSQKSFTWQVTSLSQPDNLSELLIAQGMKQEEGSNLPYMAIDMQEIPENLPVSPGFEIKICNTPSLMRSWLHIYTLEFPDLVRTLILENQYQQNPEQESQMQFYLGLLHGEPVAISMYLLSNGVAGIYSAKTLKHARRRGIGSLMVVVPLLDARQKGYRVGVLGASQMGYHLYQQLGFQEYVRLSLFTKEINV